ncbi:MAG: DUF4445 domain-containing protein [Armatimonadetes bacterium]|nr:DUF4445 domain-containing protein [Armatimonadota bacterium]
MHTVRFEPDDIDLEVSDGTPLTRAATTAGLPLELPCGGLGLCGKCKCEVIRGEPAPTLEERRWLTPLELERGTRLACRLEVRDDLTVMLSDGVRSRANQIMVGGKARATVVDSGVEKLVAVVGKAPLGDERDDWRRVQDAIGRLVAPSLAALRQMPDALRDGTGALALTVVDGRCIRVEPGLDGAAPLGFAVDIGTTTVVCYVLDLSTGAELAHAAMLNPQVAYGDDVISRIHFAGADEDGLRMLNLEIRRCIDQLVRQACEELGVQPSRLARGTIVGNATMTHLFLRINPRGLGIAPFAPITHLSVTADGQDLGLRSTPDAAVTILPNIAGFLGSDTVGVLLAAMPDPDETCLAVDIGTNGEMVLFHDGHWYGLDLGVIAGQAPRGLCGTGLFDAVASLLDAGVIEFTGRYVDDEDVPAIFQGYLKGQGNARSFRLVTAEESATGEELTLTGKDVREVQLAKASIRASIESLLARAGVTPDDIAHVYLAGGFGSYLRVESAKRIGLLPDVPSERIEVVGNGAGAGARLALISRHELAAAEELARRVDVLYLATDPVYQMQFPEQMCFPE